MEFNPSYPQDFLQALANSLTEETVNLHLQKPGSRPRFVYGPLMLPTVLKYYIGADPSVELDKSMTQATLFGYKLYQYAESSLPVIARSTDPGAAVEGMLIFNLTDRQRNSIYELEGGLTGLVNVQVEICQKDCGVHHLRAVDAGAFAWQGGLDGLTPIGTASWRLDGFLRSSFYRNIKQSQRRGSLEFSPRAPADRRRSSPARSQTDQYL